MINFYNQVPSVYTNTSRDFQYLSWLINIVLNSVKHNVDDLYDLPNTKADPRLIELLAMTLGFKVKRNYNQKQLAALVSIIPRILKYKGTTEAITLAGKALIKASGAIGMFDCEIKNNCLEILLPEELVDTTLFMDLLPYILPAGITCRVVRKTQTQAGIDSINVGYHDTLYYGDDWHLDLSWNTDTQNSTGLANIFEADTHKPNFANYKKSEADKLILNTGLLDNSMIPVLNNVLNDDKTKHLNNSK